MDLRVSKLWDSPSKTNNETPSIHDWGGFQNISVGTFSGTSFFTLVDPMGFFGFPLSKNPSK